MGSSVYTACPNIVPKDELDLRFNQPVEYTCSDGTTYTFYDHTGPFGDVTRVQFCKRIGRKRDVFECLSADEWPYCHAAPKGADHA